MRRANIVLLVLAVILAIPVTIQLVQEGQRFTVWADEPLLFEGLDPDSVEVVGYGEPSGREPAEPGGAVPRDEIWFGKVGPEQWLLVEPKEMVGAPVYGDRVVGSFIDFVLPIRRREANIVVRDADDKQLEQYGLTRSGARVISLQRKNRTPLATLYVGNYVTDAESGRGLGGYYVRDNRSTTVLFYERDRWGPTTGLGFWIDRAIHRLDETKIQSIRFTGPYTGESAVEFARDGERPHLWNAVAAPDGVGAVRQGEVTQMVVEFARASAEKVLRRVDETVLGDLKYGLSGPRTFVAVEATMEDGAKHSLHVGAQVESTSRRYAIGGTGQWLLTVKPEVFDRFARIPQQTLFDPK